MRPAVISPSPATGPSTGIFLNWHSPTPYLFGGLAVMMALIAIALTILSCSSHKSADDDSGSRRSSPCVGGAAAPTDMEPKIVVVMAGDSMPTYLAKMQALDSL